MRHQPLPMYADAKPCVRCGYCCTINTCGFGRWNVRERRCEELSFVDGLAVCGIYREVLRLPVERWQWSPAFGAGCCSPLNSRRKELLDADVQNLRT
jgi:hypothetical protein